MHEDSCTHAAMHKAMEDDETERIEAVQHMPIRGLLTLQQRPEVLRATPLYLSRGIAAGARLRGLDRLQQAVVLVRCSPQLVLQASQKLSERLRVRQDAFNWLAPRPISHLAVQQLLW